MKTIIKLTLIPIIATLAFLLMRPAAANAQGPLDCEPVVNQTYHLSQFNSGYDRFGTGLPDINNALGPGDSSTATLAGSNDRTTYWSFSPQYILSGTLTITTTASGGGAQWTVRAHSEPGQPAPCPPLHVSGAGQPACDVFAEGWFGGSSGVYNPTINGQVGSLYFSFKSGVLAYNTVNLDSMEILFTGDQCSPQAAETPPTCELVPNADFASEDDWTLGGTATITNSVLLLEQTGSAYQNIAGLSSNTTYNVAISVTNVYSGTSNLFVQLSSDLAQAADVQPGLLNVELTTGNVGGPTLFILETTGEGVVEVDYVCVSLAGSGPGGEQAECVAPTNGQFTTAANWGFHRGATWQNVSQNALLPTADSGLVRSSGSYTLPSLALGEYLLLGFDAQGNGSNSQIAGNVTAGFSDFTGYFETYPVPYRFEADISSLAGLDFATIAFANAATGTLTADVQLDNVCVFVANRPPNLPQPVDPNGITPIDLGFNYYSCDDVDGIWSFFGVNMRQYRANYWAGISFWSDPIEWLASSFWTLLGDWACIYMASFVALINTIEYAINNGLNYASWFRRSFIDTVGWHENWLLWVYQSWLNLSTKFGDFFSDWLGWFGDSATTFGDWFGDSFGDVAVWLVGFALTGIGIIPGINAIITLLNALGIDLFTLLSEATFGGRSEAAFEFISSFGPFGQVMALLYWLITGYFASVMDLIGASYDLVAMFSWWLWENVISVGHIPIYFYYGFEDGINSESYGSLVNCADENFWCVFLAAVQLVNQVSSHSIFYPIVITGIILSTIVIIWNNITDLFDIYIW